MSFTLRRGEISASPGLVGAGRTELLRAMFGLDPVRRGEVSVARVPAPLPGAALAAGGGLLSEDRKQEGLAAVLSSPTISRARVDAGSGWVRVAPPRSQRPPANWIRHSASGAGARARRWRRFPEATSRRSPSPACFISDVDVLLLDEPTRGIDVASKAQIYELMTGSPPGRRLRARAVLIVSSYLPELLGCATGSP